MNTTGGRHACWLVTLVAFLAATCGCSRHVVRAVDEEIAREGTGILDVGGQEIEGYVLVGGVEKVYAGRVRVAAGDSLLFWAKQDTVVNGSYRVIEALGPRYARESVASLRMSEVRVVSSVLLGVGIAAGVVIGLVAAAWGNDGAVPVDSR